MSTNTMKLNHGPDYAAPRKRKPRMIEEGSRTYERMANDEARNWCQLRPCRDCGAPVNDGYCCRRCESRNP